MAQVGTWPFFKLLAVPSDVAQYKFKFISKIQSEFHVILIALFLASYMRKPNKRHRAAADFGTMSLRGVIAIISVCGLWCIPVMHGY